MTPKFRTALFAGTFNPFTIGHKSIVERTLSFCDKVVIGFGCNLEKETEESEENFNRVKQLYEREDKVEVLKYKGLTIDFARDIKADFIVRGVRNTIDFEYEMNLAEVNRRISGIETILLPALPELSFISSSMVRELRAFGKDVNEFIPYQ